MNKEVWKCIKEFDDYEVSNLGRIKSYKLSKEGLILKHRQLNDNNQYCIVNLIKNDGKYHIMRIHRLVALAFCPKRLDCNLVNHIDGNKTNNVATNLEWSNHAENNQHAYEIGLRKGPTKKKRKVAKILIDNSTIIYSSVKEASRKNSISDSSIRRACTGATKTAGDYKWKFID